MSSSTEPQFQTAGGQLPSEGFVNPETVLREKSIRMLDYGEVVEGVCFQLTQYPDGDNLVWIARLYEGEDELKSQLGNIGSKIEQQHLTEIQTDRLVYCLSKLNLPLFLAVHLALNHPEIDIKDYSISNKTDFMVVTGDSESGKSTLLSAMALKFPHKIEGYSLEFFTSNSGGAYLNFLISEGITKDSSSFEILSAISRFKSKDKESRKKFNTHREAVGESEVSQVLDRLLEKCLKGQPGLILIESPGARDDTTVQITHLIRESFEIELRIVQGKPPCDAFKLSTDKDGQILPRPYLWLQTEGPGLDTDNLDAVTELIHEFNNKAQVEAKKLRENIVKKLKDTLCAIIPPVHGNVVNSDL